jgi:hypothetical protein
MNKTRAAHILCLLVFLLGAVALVFLILRNPTAIPVEQPRIKERLKNLADLRIASAQILETYGWQNKDKQVIRIPIERAMELTVSEWQNPAAARSNLLDRAAKVFAPPPLPPQPINPYE